MLTRLRHRGPDDEGLWSDGGITLGHRRLSVVDVDGGHQPMCSSSGMSAVTFGGEIYNFAKLRDAARSRGYRFRTHGDTETILAAYETDRSQWPAQLKGMFAFALWDCESRLLHLVRDRLGKKPLLLAPLGEGGYAFASEFSALLTLPQIDRRIDPQSVDLYFAYRSVPAPRTIYRGIRRLMPGEHVVVREGRNVTARRYWSIRNALPIGGLRPSPDPVRTRAEFAHAVLERLVSEVPLGAFLSGGIDSGLVVGLMAQLSAQPVRTFTVGFDDRHFDELRAARSAAEQHGTEQHETVLRPDFESAVTRLVRNFGEPFGDSSCVPMLLIAEVARRHVTVALTGDGGDELMGGYERYVAMQYANALSLGVGPLSRHLSHSIARWSRRLGPRTALARFGRLAAATGAGEAITYARLLQSYDRLARAAVLSEDLQAAVDYDETDDLVLEPFQFARRRGLSASEAATVVDYEVNLPTSLLPKLDISTMAASLEARSPLLDHELVEMSFGWPGHMKIRGLRTKLIARTVFRDLLTGDATRGTKRGFDIPVDDWLRGPLRHLLVDTLTSTALLTSGLIDENGVGTMLKDHLSWQANHGRHLWPLLMLGLWCAEQS